MPVYKQLGQRKLLLDTHIWIWLMTGNERLQGPFSKNINKKEVLISPISIWEVGMLEARGRIEFEIDCAEWVDRALEEPNFSVAPITPEIAILSSRLPEGLHGDPADRLLVSTAHKCRAVLATHDQKILKYGKDRFVGVYDPCRK